MAHSVNDILRAKRLLPVIVLQREADAVPVANALESGGLPIAEVTFRTEAAAASIAAIRKSVPGVRVGAGTITSIAQIGQAIDAGAEFLVTPGFNPRVVEQALKLSLIHI